MPRPKSDITGQRGYVGMRLTVDQRETFRKLGGVQWLRSYLDEIIKLQLQLEIETADPKGTGGVVAVHSPRPKKIPKANTTVRQSR